jgi:hypothetical protein
MRTIGLMALAPLFLIGCNSMEPQSTLSTTLNDVTINDQGVETKLPASDLINGDVEFRSSKLPTISFALNGDNIKNSGINNLNFGVRNASGLWIEFSVSQIKIGKSTSSIIQSTQFKIWASRASDGNAIVTTIDNNGFISSYGGELKSKFDIGRYLSISGNTITLNPETMIQDMSQNDPDFIPALNQADNLIVYFQVDGKLISKNGEDLSPFQFSLKKIP